MIFYTIGRFIDLLLEILYWIRGRIAGRGTVVRDYSEDTETSVIVKREKMSDERFERITGLIEGVLWGIGILTLATIFFLFLASSSK